MEASARLQMLRLHLNPDGEVEQDALGSGLKVEQCSAQSHALPRFNPSVMEQYLESNKLRQEVYDLMRKHPELLPEVTEGMRKGAPVTNLAFSSNQLHSTVQFWS
jgi:hypothetical protein